MTLAITPNRILSPGTDKLGWLLMELKNRLVATGLWRVKGSGDGNRPSGGGIGSAFAYDGLTAGPSYDIFTSDPQSNGADKVFGATFFPNSISNAFAWFVLEEIASGRCFYFQRSVANASVEGHVGIEFAPGGYNSAGCDARTGPVPVGHSRVIMGQRTATTASGTGPARYVIGSSTGLSASFTDFHAGSPLTLVAQIWVPVTARAGNVCPFIVAIVNKTTPALGGLFVYESMVDAPTNEPLPAAIVAGSWTNMATLYNGNAGPIASTTSAPSVWIGSSLLNGINAEPSMGQNLGRSPSEGRPVDSDGFWRTQRPRVHVSPYNAGTYRFLGRMEHLYANMVNRDYPTTYRVAGPDPYVTIGHFLAPWVVGVAPTWGP